MVSAKKNSDSPAAKPGPSPSRVLRLAVAGGLLMWACQPPLGLWPLAWVAPVPWLMLVTGDRLAGRRPYWVVFLGGMVYWLPAVQWIRLPHPALYPAWFALAGVMSAYVPLVVALARVGRHRWGLPLWLAAPVAWTGVEWLRSHLLTGFFMGSLAHTQVPWNAVIQMADLAGEYGVTFLMVLVAACVTQAIGAPPPRPGKMPRPRGVHIGLSMLPACLALVAALVYGHYRTVGVGIDVALQQKRPRAVRIALVQGYTLPYWKQDLDRQQDIMGEYLRLSLEAADRAKRGGDDLPAKPVDLVVWPETAFRQPLLTVDESNPPPPGVIHPDNFEAGPRDLFALVRQVDAAALVGVDRFVAGAASGVNREADSPTYDLKVYNSSVMMDREGQITGTYDKMHRVPFGEYIPLAQWFPVLYRLTPLTGGIEAGRVPDGMWLDDVLYAPNVCYETVLPHLIRRQVNYLDSRYSSRPHLLVNLTNDVWYEGSSELDMHLACGVFRAVEMRTPLVVAANGGLSAYVDRLGHIRQVTERLKTAALVVDVPIATCRSFYAMTGDWFAIGCLVLCMIVVIFGRFHVFRGFWKVPPSHFENGKRGTADKR